MRTGKGAPLVAKQFRLQEVFREGRTIDLNEGFAGPLALLVNEFGQKPFAGPGVPLNQNIGNLHVGQLEGCFQHLFHGPAFSNNLPALEFQQPQLSQLFLVAVGYPAGFIQLLQEFVQAGHVPFVDHNQGYLPVFVKSRGAGGQHIFLGFVHILQQIDLSFACQDLGRHGPIHVALVHQVLYFPADDLVGRDTDIFFRRAVDVDNRAGVVQDPDAI